MFDDGKFGTIRVAVSIQPVPGGAGQPGMMA
jgi:hypothetical protein